MARTRSTRSTAPKKQPAGTPPPEPISQYILESRPGPPQHVFILPKAATSEARVVTLPHPRSGRTSRYLFCPESGIYEFTKFSAPKHAPTSWLIEPRPGSDENVLDGEKGPPQTEVISNGAMYVATRIDPLFLVLPALVDVKIDKKSDEKKRLFLCSDDHFDKLPQQDSHFSDMLRCDAIRTLIESRMEAICDTVDAGDEKMFRLSEKKLLATIIEKAKQMGEGGLPPSMEEKFVTKALEAPVLLSRNVAMPSQPQSKAEDAADAGNSTPGTETRTPLTTPATMSDSSLELHASIAPTSFVEEADGVDIASAALQASPDVIVLQRLRVAFDFLCSRYIPSAAAELLRTQLTQVEESSVDFAPLEKYMASLTERRAEAVAASSVANYSSKRPRDEEQDELRQEKKRKLEEEKKRKANQSRGVRDLKKVNTSGMMRLSHFFKAK
ncbi:hypothetical protein E4U17_004138 [Claviceps sp. LM77 group G4]|nr:hypothetical protein E4U17_004138 [Claviceps sp. LM77 group G4]KAG6070541.1 hypothetical protein E4U33_004143 [Claviceps sp. LM78 group G4]KAG6076494.1 hypothetical protein E4U16_002742 [Claviceps sp. LM84 group G4]